MYIYILTNVISNAEAAKTKPLSGPRFLGYNEHFDHLLWMIFDRPFIETISRVVLFSFKLAA